MNTDLEAAIRWIGGELRANPKADRVKLADRASLRFNLSPKDGDFLMRVVRELAPEVAGVPKPPAATAGNFRGGE